MAVSRLLLLRWLTLAVIIVLHALSGAGAGTLLAAEYPFALPIAPSSQTIIAIPAGDLAQASALHVHFRRDQSAENTGKRVSELEVVLATSDGRYFSSADLIDIDDDAGATHIPLDGAHWGSNGGVLGADAISSIQSIMLRVHAPRTAGTLTGTIDLDGSVADSSPSFQVQLLAAGLIDRGPWRELQLRLVGDPAGETGEVDLVDQGALRPLFLDQQLEVEDGRWRAQGPAHWVLRVRPDEVVAGTLHWHLGTRTWDSQPLPHLALCGRLPLPEAPAQSLPVPSEPAWTGRGYSCTHGEMAMLARLDLPACLVPILCWNDQWGGFRGAQRISWPQAAACDLAFARGCPDIELAPQMLLEEQGTFRFGLSPWQALQGGPWKTPRDAWTVDQPWLDLRHHAREVIARARATPGLTQWRLGLQAVATGPAELRRVHDFITDLATLVANIDGRPLIILHPQAVDYAFDDSKVTKTACWYGFEDSVGDWSGGPFPITSQVVRDPTLASEGAASLSIPMTTALASGQWAGGAFVYTDLNLFNLDQLDFDAVASAPGSIQLYVWVTDEYHRWFQQRLQCIPADGRWRTVIVDFNDAAAWQCPPGVAWGAQVRRRIRRMGVIGFFHPTVPGATLPAPSFNIDRVARFGWPRITEPSLTVTVQSPAPSTIALYEPLSVDFALNLPARNPYDPDSADVVGEAEGPGGVKITFPAYWSEPMAISMRDGTEAVTPTGEGGWHWRFAPTVPGAWRYRLHAKIRWRTQWKDGYGEWTTAQVAPASDDAMPPVRVSSRDPQCFETVDGAYFYPLGINLRSPGDSRQDQVLSEVPAAAPTAPGVPAMNLSGDWERLGTHAYERWFPLLHAHGMNWARVWMCPWWCGVEWTRAWDGYGGLTDYNQAQAARLDRVLDLARASHIYVQIELMNHGMAGDFADHQWEDSPYNAANGGMCPTPVEFFSSDEAFAATAKRYRYTMARWGWRSHLTAWVLSSELEFTGAWHSETGGDEDNGRSPSTQKWVDASLAWYKANDPWPRPVSIHFSHPWDGSTLWPTQGLGFNNSNAYTGFQDMGRLGGRGWSNGSGRDLPLALDIYLEQHFPPWRYHRPTVVGEWGGHWSTNESATLAQEFHAGLWLQAVMPYAGNIGFWWWLWVDKTNTWNEYAQVARFIANDDRRGLVWRVNRPVVVGSKDVSVMGMSCASAHRFYVYLTHSDQDGTLPAVADAGFFTVNTGAANSTWRAERWSCAQGAIERSALLHADAKGLVQIPLHRIAPDCALKLTLVGP